MNQVEVDVVELELTQRLTHGALHIVVIVVPQLGGNVKLLAGHASSDALLKGLTDLLLVCIDLGGIDVAVPVLKDGLLDHLLGVVGHKESA